MSKHKVKPANKLPKRNGKNKYDLAQRKNIFQLTENLFKEIPLANENIKDKFAYTEKLILFLNEKHPEELFKEQFNPEMDTIQTLAGRLSNLVISLGYTIVFEEANEDTIRILFPIKKQDFLLYILDYSWINDIQSEELRIGYVHLLKHIGQFAYINSEQYSYLETDDNCFEQTFDFMQDECHYLDEEGKIDEGIQQEVEENAEEELKRMRQWKERVDEYLNKDYQLFLDYNSTNINEQNFKEFIQKGMLLDYSIITDFMPSCDCWNDGGVSFEESLIIFFDSGMGVEEKWLEEHNEYACNEWADPTGWYSVSSTEIKLKTTDEQINQLFDNFQYLIDLFDNHLNQIKKWNL